MGTPQAKPEAESAPTAAPASRADIRNKILSAKAETRVLDFFGTRIEIRQPSLGTVMEMRKGSLEDASAQMLIQYTFVPEKDENGNPNPDAGQRVFEPADAEAILELPFGPDMNKFTDTVNELMGVDAKALEALIANARKSPGDGRSEADNDADSGGAGEGSSGS